MYEDGFRAITNCDFSDTVINRMCIFYSDNSFLIYFGSGYNDALLCVNHPCFVFTEMAEKCKTMTEMKCKFQAYVLYNMQLQISYFLIFIYSLKQGLYVTCVK